MYIAAHLSQANIRLIANVAYNGVLAEHLRKVERILQAALDVTYLQRSRKDSCHRSRREIARHDAP
jgi:hypothetical protein